MSDGVTILRDEYEALLQARRERDELLRMVNSPEIQVFLRGVELEITHQRRRWGSVHDAGKEPYDWHWLVAHLAGKALFHHQESKRLAILACDFYPEFDGANLETIPNELMRMGLGHHREKALHHTITAAAALANWHAHMTGAHTRMRPGIDPSVAWPFPEKGGGT